MRPATFAAWPPRTADLGVLGILGVKIETPARRQGCCAGGNVPAPSPCSLPAKSSSTRTSRTIPVGIDGESFLMPTAVR